MNSETGRINTSPNVPIREARALRLRPQRAG
jgi:hypothetical protein